MPNRVIRDGLIDSERYWSVSTDARQMFVHMLLLADDYGCVSVSATFLRRRCFNDAPSHDRIARLLNEIQDADLVRLYEHERGCYGFIPRFRQRLQRQTLKHPAPPKALYEDDPHACELFSKINDKTINPTVGQQRITVGQRESTVGQPPEVKRSEGKRREEKENKTDVSPADRGSRLPSDWSPPSDVMDWARQERPDLDLAMTLEEFRDYWLSVPGARGRKLDWRRTWRNWVRSSKGQPKRPRISSIEDFLATLPDKP